MIKRVYEEFGKFYAVHHEKIKMNWRERRFEINEDEFLACKKSLEKKAALEHFNRLKKKDNNLTWEFYLENIKKEKNGN